MTIVLAGAGSTNSRGHRPLPPGAMSARTLYGDGVRELTEFTYADGHKARRSLLSWVGGQAGLIFGHGPYPEPIARAIQSPQVSGSYGHKAEWDLADALDEALNGVFATDDLACRFGLNGKDVLDAAARIARAATGREPVAAQYSYHGAGEAWVHPPYPEGIPQAYRDLSRTFAWGDVASVRSLARECAAICIDAPALPDDEVRAFLAECRRACDDGGAVFILDEVVSGFRFGLQGASGRYGVKPDIACYGKAMSAVGNVSAIVGRRDLVDLLDGRVFYSLTFGGSPWLCSIAAETVRYLAKHQDEIYPHLHLIGTALKDGLNALGIKCVGQPERSVCTFPTDAEWLAWCSAMIERNVMCHRPQFPTISHQMRDVKKTLEVAAEVSLWKSEVV